MSGWSKFWHALAHVGLVALQVVNAAVPVIPAPWNIAAAGGIAAIQGALGVQAASKAKAPETGKSNPGNTPSHGAGS